MRFVSTSIYLLSFLLVFIALTIFSPIVLIEWELSVIPLINISSNFTIDLISWKFILVVLIISSWVIIYSNRYIDDEKNSLRFIFLVLIFVSRMLILIVGGSVPLLLIGWDGLGLSSYFLIVHYQTFKSSGRGLITVIRNRIGDIFIIITSLLLFSEITSWLFFHSSSTLNKIFILGVIILLGAITKRAIFPYSTWLPEAIAAPTPVSSLVHSSTLVTAGVYLILRRVPWLPLNLLLIIGAISRFTLILSRGRALFCLDFKKVIALSTLSQLAFIITTLSLNLIEIAFFHLITHALFKSSLFMSTGSLIHLRRGNQDIRFKDTLSFPAFRGIIVVIPLLALIGFPFLAGYFSKEIILLTSFFLNLNLFFLATLVLGALLTIFYRIRIMFSLTFNNVFLKSLKETSFIDFRKALLILSSISVGWFYFLKTDLIFSPSPQLITLVQRLFLLSLTIWLSNKILFSPYLAISWNQFNYLGRTTNTLIPNLQAPFRLFSQKLWEGGWQEVFGPSRAQTLLVNSLNKLYTLSNIHYQPMIISFFFMVLRLLVLL